LGSPGLLWAVAAFVILVLLGGAFATLPMLEGSPGAARQGDGSPPGVSPSDGTPPPPTDSPPPTTNAPPSPAPAVRPATPADQITALQTMLAQQADTGQVDPGTASDLRSGLDDIARRLSKGQTGQVTSRIAQLRDRLTGLAQDGKLTAGGYQVLTAGLAQLAGSLTPKATPQN
jgi:hypothetical protein